MAWYSCGCSCLRRTLEGAATADVSGMLDLNIHMTRAKSRHESYSSLQQARVKLLANDVIIYDELDEFLHFRLADMANRMLD